MAATLSEEISAWYRSHGEEKSCLLPQNLSDELLSKLSQAAETVIKSGDENQDLWEPFITIVGLLLANPEDKTFRESAMGLGAKARTYAINMTIETMRRSKVLEFSKNFSLEDILDLGFERGFSLSNLGQQAAEQLRDAATGES